MGPLFEILFLEDAFNFLRELDRKHYEKIIYNLRRAQVELNPELFKKNHGRNLGVQNALPRQALSLAGFLG